MAVPPSDAPDAPNAGAPDAHDAGDAHDASDALVEIGVALSRALDVERVYAEAARQARQAVRASACCLAVADEDTAALRVAHAEGYAADAPAERARLEQRLLPAWLDALANAQVVARPVDARPVDARPVDARDVADAADVAADAREFTAPLTSPEGVLGAMTVRVPGAARPARAAEAARVLRVLAAQTAAALERAYLVRRVEQKRRLEAIGEVAAGVAHELRNPLFGISSAAQLLRFRVPDDPVVDKNVGRILREVERLNRMVTALLDYGRPSAPRLAPGDPDLVWDDVLDGARGRLEAGRLTLARTRADPADGRWLIDAEQLGQVFLNLLVNAADAAPPGSTLTLVSAVLPAGAWRCRLHNPGPAIPPEALARAFEIFYSTKPGGTGIGLALCQRIVDEHGGSVAIESAPEAGTAVTVTLPGA